MSDIRFKVEIAASAEVIPAKPAVATADDATEKE